MVCSLSWQQLLNSIHCGQSASEQFSAYIHPYILWQLFNKVAFLFIHFFTTTNVLASTRASRWLVTVLLLRVPHIKSHYLAHIQYLII